MRPLRRGESRGGKILLKLRREACRYGVCLPGVRGETGAWSEVLFQLWPQAGLRMSELWNRVSAWSEILPRVWNKNLIKEWSNADEIIK